MLNNRIKANIAIAISVGTLGIGAYSLNQATESIEELKVQQESNIKLNEKLNNTIKDLQDTIKEQSNIIEEQKKSIEDSIKALQQKDTELEKSVKEAKSLAAAAKTTASKTATTASTKTTNTQESVSRGVSTRTGTPITLKLSFYGDFAYENGGYGGMDAQGNKLVAGTVASNVYPFGTKFVFNGQTYTVRDRGGSHFNSSNRLDVFVPRKSGETDAQYASRISSYGRQTVQGYIIK